MPRQAIDLAGQRFGRLVVASKFDSKPNGIHWLCKCDCGNQTIVCGAQLRRKENRTSSCGCYKKEQAAARLRKQRARCKPKDEPRFEHGHFANGKMTATYQSWHMMIQRCTNPKRADYVRYGGRGIKVCKRWRGSFEAFLSDMGKRPAGRTLDRINNNGDYRPSNCRWATLGEQGANQRR